ncbi:hypothetical protein [Nitrococcus mobilis]|uniref:Transposase n=1 Tax=Nitrococcus mobilis Nb-231 TaxID=314278 RepID=A4BTE3_9GAMM|nr:hypothetical protein [Nitrococcus mobilis]EAR21045.1 hypothetical protein NB231_07742 [Nitrococcus mobilis Nb-231]
MVPLTLHPLVRTTLRTRVEIKAEAPDQSDQTLARLYGVAAPTVRKWRERECTTDRSQPREKARGRACL